jgi:hypothetical protein
MIGYNKNNMTSLHLILKKQWFDLIASGEKLEEYREVTDYWIKRLVMGGIDAYCCYYEPFKFKRFDTVTFQHGYAKNSPRIVCEFKGIEVGIGKAEWGAPKENVFIIKLGKILKPCAG